MGGWGHCWCWRRLFLTASLLHSKWSVFKYHELLTYLRWAHSNVFILLKDYARNKVRYLPAYHLTVGFRGRGDHIKVRLLIPFLPSFTSLRPSSISFAPISDLTLTPSLITSDLTFEFSVTLSLTSLLSLILPMLRLILALSPLTLTYVLTCQIVKSNQPLSPSVALVHLRFCPGLTSLTHINQFPFIVKSLEQTEIDAAGVFDEAKLIEHFLTDAQTRADLLGPQETSEERLWKLFYQNIAWIESPTFARSQFSLIPMTFGAQQEFLKVL